jgi:hypothetical protein
MSSAAVIAASVGLAGCLLPSAAEIDASNCANTVIRFERMYCDNIIPIGDQLGGVEFNYRQIQARCSDSNSQRRLADLDSSCIERYRAVVAKRATRDDQIRKQYAAQVAALRADPAYHAAVDHWRRAHDEAEIAEQEYDEHGQPIRSAYERRVVRSTAELRAAEDRVRLVISNHGIDPRYAETLGVW